MGVIGSVKYSIGNDRLIPMLTGNLNWNPVLSSIQEDKYYDF